MFNTTLPIYPRRNDIVTTVRKHPVTIIVTPPGGGKSTQVPQFLLAEGYDLVVTQPRRLATRTVSARVAKEFGTPFGEVVGFRTAYERQDSEATRCLFVTDGLALVRELMGAGNHSVLVIDEVHEWNLNIEVLVAWAKRQIEEDASFKVVLMSATLEADRLSAYFGGAPIIDVPGRLFPVEEQAPTGARLEDDVVRLLRQGRNVLVFQPGKREIGETIGRLEELSDLNAQILPLHGELTSEEQDKCFDSYGRPKCVVSTNLAETAVTIEDIDAVVDSGMERRIELVDGVEGLYLKPISLANGAQRRGRAGRTKPGTYIDWCPSPNTDRLEFPEAEILRVRLDQAVLRLAEAGFDMEELRFFHQPDIGEIHDAKRALVALGCMEKTGRVTPIGRRVARMPIAVQYGRMIVEADKLGVVDDVITVAAILEQGGVTARICPTHQRTGYKSCACWQRLAPGEETSDVIAQMLAYKACMGMTKEEMREGGIFIKAFYQAKEKRRHLANALKGKVRDRQSSGKREDILRAVCAGMVDHLYQYVAGQYKNGGSDYRELARESVVTTGSSWEGTRVPWLVGRPFDLQIKTRRGPITLHLIGMATKVQLTWLAEVAPHLVEIKAGLNPRYDWNQDEVVSTTETWFNGQQVENREVLDSDHAEAARLRREGRNHRQWQDWADKPEVSLPDPTNESVTIPEIVVCTYGADAETGEPLMAYGTITPYGHRYYSTDPWFKILWTRDESEAERNRQEAVSRLEAIRAEAKTAAERQRRTAEAEQLKQTAEPLRQRVSTMYQAYYYGYGLVEDMRSRLHGYSHLPYTSDPEVVRQWMADAEALVAEVEAAVATVEAQKAETARQLADCLLRTNSLRDEAGKLRREHDRVLTVGTYHNLTDLDTDDGDLPTDLRELEIWISDAQVVIAEAHEEIRYAADASVPVDVSALMARFNSR